MQTISPQKMGPVLKVCIPVTSAQTKQLGAANHGVQRMCLLLLFYSISSPAFLSVERGKYVNASTVSSKQKGGPGN